MNCAVDGTCDVAEYACYGGKEVIDEVLCSAYCSLDGADYGYECRCDY